MKLTIELVPTTSWYNNVRSNVSKEKWNIIRTKSYKKANYKCEICNGKGDDHPVECHEIWDYNDEKNIQKLIGFISLCPNCHKTKHIGLSMLYKQEDIAIEQLMKVNNMTEEEALEYIDKSFEIWHERSNKKWKIEISYIDKYLENY